VSHEDIPQGYRQSEPLLTARQLEILDLIKLGCTYEEIGRRLGMTGKAVTNRVSNGILSRLGATNRAHAVYIAMKRKLIS
jgi:DNA-binding NarL/FixJ family response regulator